MTSALFRKQAVEEQNDRLWGEVLLIQPLSSRLLTLIIVIVVSALIAYLFWGSFARKETVNGHLTPTDGVVRVTAPRSGVIESVLVREGEQVTAGQPMFVVNGDSVLADGRHLESVLLEEYEHKRKLLEQQRDRIPDTYDRKLNGIERESSALLEDIHWLNEQKSTLQQRLVIVDKRLASLRKLKKSSLASENDVQAVIAERLGVLSELQNLERNLANQKHQHEKLESRTFSLATEEQNRLDQINTELSSLAQQVAELHGRKAYVIEAKRGGTVTVLQAAEGQNAQPGAALATLLPTNSILQAELFVPTRAIGFIKEGQEINIRYSAFPYQKFGLYQGNIAQVSDHVILPNEWRNMPIQTQEPMYRVTATLKQQDVIAFGRNTPLRPGILLDADITLGKRNLVQWLLEPLYSLKGRV